MMQADGNLKDIRHFHEFLIYEEWMHSVLLYFAESYEVISLKEKRSSYKSLGFQFHSLSVIRSLSYML